MGILSKAYSVAARCTYSSMRLFVISRGECDREILLLIREIHFRSLRVVRNTRLRLSDLSVDLMKSHPLHIPHPWTHSESPHATLAEEIKYAVPDGSSQPAQLVTTSYPDVEPYPSEETALLRAKHEVWRGWRILKIVRQSTAGFLNPPMIGGIAATIAGVVPFLHIWLFDQHAVFSP